MEFKSIALKGVLDTSLDSIVIFAISQREIARPSYDIVVFVSSILFILVLLKFIVFKTPFIVVISTSTLKPKISIFFTAFIICNRVSLILLREELFSILSGPHTSVQPQLFFSGQLNKFIEKPLSLFYIQHIVQNIFLLELNCLYNIYYEEYFKLLLNLKNILTNFKIKIIISVLEDVVHIGR